MQIGGRISHPIMVCGYFCFVFYFLEGAAGAGLMLTVGSVAERVPGRDYRKGWKRYGFAASFARDQAPCTLVAAVKQEVL